MIIFSWTITPNQIVALRSVADHHRRYELAASRKDRALLADNPLSPPGFGHWFTAVRGLIREGFITHTEVPLEKWERGVDGYVGKVRQSWKITPKGLLMLQIVSIEVEEQGKVLALDKQQLRLLKAA